jgi:hypothetical protein
MKIFRGALISIIGTRFGQRSSDVERTSRSLKSSSHSYPVYSFHPIYITHDLSRYKRNVGYRGLSKTLDVLLPSFNILSMRYLIPDIQIVSAPTRNNGQP